MGSVVFESGLTVLVLVAAIALAGLVMLRQLATWRQRQVEAYEAQREAARLRKAYLQRLEERRRKYGTREAGYQVVG
jgi:ABC-type transport system involved in cytochrome bd biosynthesis fused ATPase/permease subunit